MIKSQHKKVLFTGGHAGSTAYALIEEIKKRNLYWDIFFVGSRSAVEGKKVETYEEKILPKLGVRYLPLTTGRVQRRFTFWTIPSLLKIPLGFFGALRYLLKINPDIVVSFGGFVGFPVVVMAKLLGKKVFVHEQTSVVGLSNRYSAIFADKVFISRENSKKYLPKEKIVLTGNPISEEILSLTPKNKLGTPPMVVVTGGSRGSVYLNKAVEEMLPLVSGKFNIIHQVGTVEFDKFKNIKENLNNPKWYQIYSVSPPEEWKKVLALADVIVSRAGANTVSELMIIKTPCVLVPLPFIYLNEQSVNAESLKHFGTALVIKQDDLNKNSLLAAIEDRIKNWDKVRKETLNKTSPDLLAAEKIVSLLEESLK